MLSIEPEKLFDSVVTEKAFDFHVVNDWGRQPERLYG